MQIPTPIVLASIPTSSVERCPCQHGLLFDFLNMAILSGVKGSSVIVFCFFLMVSDAGHFFMYALAIVLLLRSV